MRQEAAEATVRPFCRPCRRYWMQRGRHHRCARICDTAPPTSQRQAQGRETRGKEFHRYWDLVVWTRRDLRLSTVPHRPFRPSLIKTVVLLLGRRRSSEVAQLVILEAGWTIRPEGRRRHRQYQRSRVCRDSATYSTIERDRLALSQSSQFLAYSAAWSTTLSASRPYM